MFSTFHTLMAKIDVAAQQAMPVRVRMQEPIALPPVQRGPFYEGTGDIWDWPAEVRVITTNGVVKKDGRLVMGVGCAKQARDMWPDIDLLLGVQVASKGNIVHIAQQEPLIVSFPTKHAFHERADLKLIRESACQLVMLADERHWQSIVMPRPGCGAGGLWWLKDVRPILAEILDERFTVVHNGGYTRLYTPTEVVP